MISGDFKSFIELIDTIIKKVNCYFAHPARTTAELAVKPVAEAQLAVFAAAKTAYVAARKALRPHIPPQVPDVDWAAWGAFAGVFKSWEDRFVLAAGKLLALPGAPVADLTRVLQLEKAILEKGVVCSIRNPGNCTWPAMPSTSASSSL